MKIVLKIMLAMIVAVVCAVAANAQNSASIKQQINEAVLKVYNEELDKNPDDYFTLNGRANQYFLNGDYLRKFRRNTVLYYGAKGRSGFY